MKQIIKKPLLLFITITLTVVALTVSCSFTKGKEQGERAVEQFHQQFNAGQYREIYQQSDKQFQDATKEAEFIEFMEAIRRKLGTIEKADPAGWRVNATPTGTVVALGYETQFSEGKGTEQFTFLISGDQAKLLGYNVYSPLLITR